MPKLSLPAIARLEATPEILRLLMEGLNDEDARWKPAPERWSVAEVLEHLSHLEGHAFLARLDRILQEECPSWEPYDEKAYEAAGVYAQGDPEESFAHFEEQRETALEILRGVDAGMVGRTANHAEAGLVTLEEFLNAWAIHDLGHIRQIAELVRARQLYPKLGGYQPMYTVRP